ncbi:MAG: hypothetical protein ACJASG_000164 [Oleiphilaceae bacterium]|jgi:hypothetical protein
MGMVKTALIINNLNTTQLTKQIRKNMTHFINITLSLFLLLTTTVFAGSGHNHGHGQSHTPATKAEAEKTATESVTKMVERKTIDSSWKSISVHKSEQKEFSGKKEWVVIFKNKKINDQEKQILYIFLSLEGQYLAANYTGN